MASYSDLWFALFLDTIDAQQTQREVDFLVRQMPRSEFTTLLDVCCGSGRHAHRLAERGYRVTGVDANAAAVARARRDAHGPHSAGERYLALDMRSLAQLDATFDGALCLWQSFGHFDAATNARVLADIALRVRRGGRLVLDIYQRVFFERHVGERSHERLGRTIVERKRMQGDRLTVELTYGADVPGDCFAWQVFTAAEISALAARVGLRTALTCSLFDERIAADGEQPRMQLVFERE